MLADKQQQQVMVRSSWELHYPKEDPNPSSRYPFPVAVGFVVLTFSVYSQDNPSVVG